MIRSIVIGVGIGIHAEAAQKYALFLAGLFSARVRAVIAWEGGTEEPRMMSATLIEQGKKADLTVEERQRGEGVEEGLLAEARTCDILVIGLPAGEEDSDGLALLRRAECSLLLVSRPPTEIGKILVNYQGGLEGKRALQLAGEVATRAGARLAVLSISSDPREVTRLTAMAADYLSAFNLPDIERIEYGGPADDFGKILEAADETRADLIALGADIHGLLEHFLSRDVVERLALETDVPLLIAR